MIKIEPIIFNPPTNDIDNPTKLFYFKKKMGKRWKKRKKEKKEKGNNKESHKKKIINKKSILLSLNWFLPFIKVFSVTLSCHGRKTN